MVTVIPLLVRWLLQRGPTFSILGTSHTSRGRITLDLTLDQAHDVKVPTPAAQIKGAFSLSFRHLGRPVTLQRLDVHIVTHKAGESKVLRLRQSHC